MFGDREFKCYIFLFILYSLIKDSVESKDFKNPASEFSRYSITYPTIYHVRTKREIQNSRNEDGAHHSKLKMKVSVDGEELVLDLTLNEDLITDGHVLQYQKDGKIVQHKPNKEDLDLCQYSGSIEGKPESRVAVSTCHGVRGVIFEGEKMRYIEPAEGNDIKSRHYIYDHSDLITKHNVGYASGVTNKTNYDAELIKKHQNEKHMKRSRVSRHKRHADVMQVRGPYNANKLTRYVELVLVVDNREFRANGENLYSVHRHMKDIANIINSVYAPLNIFIALVGVVVWNERDEIQLEENSKITLDNFLHYRKTKLVMNVPNDNAYLLTRQEFENSVVGKAYTGTMCTQKQSGGVATNHSKVIGLVAATIAHEIGHNFGMEHDTEEDCKCPNKKCIMNPYSTSEIPTQWSSCSLQALVVSFEKGMDYCLRNKPKRLFGTPTCGNGFVEPGEQCDCGLTIDNNDRNACHGCCDPKTCMLRSNATCGAGTCCDFQSCRPKSIGTVCRSADRECDLPEYCTGHSEFCPKDVYKMDTTPCGTHDQQAYCVRGSCRSHTDQCRLLWGTTGESTPHEYYNNNINGKKNGNCGYDRIKQVFKPCAIADVMCGMLQCRHLNKDLKFGTQALPVIITQYNYGKDKVTSFSSAIIDFGLSDVDPGLVPDGAKCGHEKMCLKQECVSVEVVRASIAAKDSSVCHSNCSGHGVCNSAGHCHCDAGFAPPLCEFLGVGDSYESGPITDTSIQRNFMVAMYIIFLGIVPLILLILFLVYYSRHKVFFWWKKPRKSYVDYFLCTCCCKQEYSHKTTFANRFAKFKNITISLQYLLSFKKHKTTTNNVEADVSSQVENHVYDIPEGIEKDVTLDYKILDIADNKSKNTKILQKPLRKINKNDITLANSSEAVRTRPIVLKKPVTNEIKSNVSLIKQNLACKSNDLVNVRPPAMKKPELKGNKPTVLALKQSLASKSIDAVNARPSLMKKPDLKDNKSNVLIVKQGLASTTNEMIVKQKSNLYNVNNNNNGVQAKFSSNNVNVHGLKK